MLTREDVLSLYDYDQETGSLFFKKGKGGENAGARAGSLHKSGYVRICINYEEHQLHRIVWLIEHGEFPSDEIDHINTVRTDNRICNLRIATRPQNLANRKTHKTNKSGHKGVHWDPEKKLWRAQISVGGKKKFIGRFKTADEAGKAYREAATLLHGEFAREA
jgi:hypothetical protein